MSAFLGLAPIPLAAVLWVALHRLNRRTGWFRLGELLFWDAVALVLIYLLWLRWF